jgi:uncharacterized protein
MPNRLARENSPYLLQHAENPVDWYPWGEEALERARQEDKPIFLSIGYAACHWCHVMEHESFEDPETARVMNENFINIKVDREERPDLDNIYMDAVTAMTGQGGWPMSVFLTPQGEPFYGGTYFPPTARYGMPSFSELLHAIARAWKNDRDDLLRTGRQVAEHLQQANQIGGTSTPLQTKTLEDAAMRLSQSYDWKNGGWGKAPKFPQPMTISLLLQRAAQGDRMALDIAVHALEAMAKGGMYDVVGGGFARYSTDDRWLVPHFEKMLYDNALLARAYLHGYLLTKRPYFKQVCEETLDFIVRDLMTLPIEGALPAGGFFSSLDADSEGEEGLYYIWTPGEIKEALGDERDSEFITVAYGVAESGNFEGANVLQRAASDKELAEQFGFPVEDVPGRLKELHQRLLKARQQRVAPGTDDKVLTAWNALALTAFAEAARYLNREDYLEIARKNADFLLTELASNGRLLRSWRRGRAQHNAYLEDYAGLVLGLLALYQSDPDPYWYSSANELLGEMLAHFKDPAGGFFDTRSDHGPLLTRPKDMEDNAIPSGSSQAAWALLQLSAYSGNGEWRDIAEEMLRSIQSLAARYPTAFGNWLAALDFALNPVLEVAVVGDLQSQDASALVDALWSQYRPHLIAAISDYPPPSNSPALLHDRPLVDDKPSAYVCRQFVCQRPVTDPQALQEQLDQEA